MKTVTSADPDPNLYFVPEGSIELSQAVEETVKRWFGQRYVSELTSEMVQEKITKPKKQRRARRWALARNLLIRALRTERLRAYLLDGDQRKLVDRSYWSEWEPSWRVPLINPLGKPNEPVYLLDRNEWSKWAENCISPAMSKDIGGLSSKRENDRRLFTRKRGRKPKKLKAVIESMKSDLESGKTTLAALDEMKEEALAAEYGASRDTVRKARKSVLSGDGERSSFSTNRDN